MAYGSDQFAKSFLGTLQALSTLESNELQNRRVRDEMEREKQADIAFKETYGRVGQADDYSKAIQTGGAGTQQARMLSDQGAMSGNTPEDIDFERASAGAAQGALRENAVRQGAIPADAAAPGLTPETYQTLQASKDYRQKTAGIGRKFALEASQLGTAMRQADNEENFFSGMDKLTQETSKDRRLGEVGSMSEVYKHGKSLGLELKYNDKAKTVTLLNSRGEPVKVYSDTGSLADSIAEHRTAAFFEKEAPKYVSSPKEAFAMWNDKRRRDIAEKEWTVKEPIYQKQAQLIDAQIDQMRTKTSAFEDKLPDGKKMLLNSLKSNADILTRAATTDPTPQNTIAAQRAQFTLYKQYQNLGMEGVDPYQMSGLPTPDQAASGILGPKPNKIKQKEIDEQIGKAERLFGKEYATEVRSAIDAKREVKRNDKGEVVQPANAPKAAATALPVGRNTKQAEFYAGKLASAERALETETNPRRRAALQIEVNKLKALSQ